MNDDLTKKAPMETLCKPKDPWISKDTKPYNVELLDNVKQPDSNI